MHISAAAAEIEFDAFYASVNKRKNKN